MYTLTSTHTPSQVGGGGGACEVLAYLDGSCCMKAMCFPLSTLVGYSEPFMLVQTPGFPANLYLRDVHIKLTEIWFSVSIKYPFLIPA